MEPCGTAAMGSSLSSIAPDVELNSTVCDLLLLAKWQDYWRCLSLGHPWALSGACIYLLQISPSKRQSREGQASLKAALSHSRYECLTVIWSDRHVYRHDDDGRPWSKWWWWMVWFLFFDPHKLQYSIHFLPTTLQKQTQTKIMHQRSSHTQGNCATEGNSGNCQSGNCHSGERWMRKPSVHGGKWKSNEGIDNIANGPVNNMSFVML